MRTQKINNIDDLLNVFELDELMIQDKVKGTLGVYYKDNETTRFKSRIGINFRNIPEMPEVIPNNTAFLSAISSENEITILDTLIYDEASIFSKPLKTRLEYTKRHSDILKTQKTFPLTKEIDLNNVIIKPLTSIYKLSKQNSCEYLGEWFTLNDHTQDVIVKSMYINDNQKFFRCFQIIDGKMRKVCNISVSSDIINKKLSQTVKNNKRAVITIKGKMKEDKIKNPQFIAIKKNKPFNSVDSLNDRMFTSFEIITIGNKKETRKFISRSVDGFTSQRGIIR
jgi:hypothetical protein